MDHIQKVWIKMSLEVEQLVLERPAWLGVHTLPNEEGQFVSILARSRHTNSPLKNKHTLKPSTLAIYRTNGKWRCVSWIAGWFTFRDFEFVGVHIVTSNWSVISKHVTLATTLEPLNSGHTGDQAFCP